MVFFKEYKKIFRKRELFSGGSECGHGNLTRILKVVILCNVKKN